MKREPSTTRLHRIRNLVVTETLELTDRATRLEQVIVQWCGRCEVRGLWGWKRYLGMYRGAEDGKGVRNGDSMKLLEG